MIDGRALLAWGDRDERRRRAARSGLGRVPAWVWAALAGGGLFAEIARSLGAFGDAAAAGTTPRGTSNLWLAAIIAAHSLVLFGAPFRMYWRRDSTLLARLAIPGDALFRLALARTLRATALVALPSAFAALAFGLWGDWTIAGRHLALVGVAALGAGCLGPAAALAAGAVVASDKAQQLLGSMGGEVSAPKTSWLGILPGLAASALALGLIAARPWAQGAASTVVGDPWVVLAAGVAAPIAALAWALRSSEVMLAALREVAALDRERLAHVDLTRPSPIDRGVAALLPRGAGLVYDKDARLARRRYPIPYFFGFVGVVVTWILAAARPDDLLLWAGVVAAFVGAYGVVMARRHAAPPIEHPAFLRTLAVGSAALAKRARASAWTLVYVVVAIVPAIARAPDVAVAGVVLGGIAVVSWAAAAAASRV